MTSPAFCRPSAFDSFAHSLSGLETRHGLIEAASNLALHEKPEAEVAQVVPAIEHLASSVRQRVHSSDPEAILAHLHDMLFDVLGLRGNVDDYYNSSNSYLTDVLRTRRGIPISLVLLYRGVAMELGLTVHGVNAPGHFLAAVEVGKSSPENESLIYVDPFYGGGLLKLDEVFERISQSTGQVIKPDPQLLARATPRSWLLRMLNNLQAVFASSGRHRDLYAMQELQQLL